VWFLIIKKLGMLFREHTNMSSEQVSMSESFLEYLANVDGIFVKHYLGVNTKKGAKNHVG
jgi:hypothetical protein